MKNSLEMADKKTIDQLMDIFAGSPVALEIFSQIYAAPNEGKSAYDIKVTLPSGKVLAYSSVHRWIKILVEKNAIEIVRQVKSEKRGTKIFYVCTKKGEQAYNLAVDYINRRTKAAEKLLQSARNQSTTFPGLAAPDLLKVALELAKASGIPDRKNER